jgi:hypothetical protein
MAETAMALASALEITGGRPERPMRELAPTATRQLTRIVDEIAAANTVR